MGEFIAEAYVARRDAAAVEAGANRTRAVADELTRQGCSIRFLRTIFVPEDETCFYLFEASSASVVRDVGDQAGVRFEHVTRASSP
jgi:hypothetical protein